MTRPAPETPTPADGVLGRQDGLTDQVRDAPLPWLPDREEIARVIRDAIENAQNSAMPEPWDVSLVLSERAADSILALLSRPSEGGTVSVAESGSSPAAPVKSESARKSDGGAS